MESGTNLKQAPDSTALHPGYGSSCKAMKKAVVLLSGGLDSITTLELAKEQGYECYALSLDYGQRHNAELVAASRLAKTAGVAHKVIQLGLGDVGGSALTDADIEVWIGGTMVASYTLTPGESVREFYAGINEGPVQVVSTNGKTITAAMRTIYNPGGAGKISFSEIMGLPVEQLRES